jgi:two-component system chemotaxis sensor kinase CheA
LGTLADITPMKILEQKAEKIAREGRSLFKILQSKPIFLNILHSLYEDSELPNAKDPILTKRYVHTVKGECAFFELQELVDICHKWENQWVESYQASDLNTFLTQIRSKMDETVTKYDKVLKLKEIAESNDIQLNVPLSGIKTLIRETTKNLTQEQILLGIENLVTQPPEEVFAWLNETWLMEAAKLGKKVFPIQWKPSAPLFAEPYKKLFSTFVHAIRNAADHGIEHPNERVSSGKIEQGSLTAHLSLKDSVYHFRLIDDGKGLKTEAILEKAKKLGIPIPKTEEEIHQLIFEDSFSTKDAATQTSGRGVGLSSIRGEAQALDGGAWVFNTSRGGMELHVWFRKVPITKILG